MFQHRLAFLLVVQNASFTGPLSLLSQPLQPVAASDCPKYQLFHAQQVLEETGVRARFDCVLAMRQAHGFAFVSAALRLGEPVCSPWGLRARRSALCDVR